MESFWILDKDKGIWTSYWVNLEGVSLDFDSSWTRSEVGIFTNLSESSDEVEGCIRWVGPRSLEWVPSTRCHINDKEDILVDYGEGDDGPPDTSVIVGGEYIEALAQGAEYPHGSARLEIKRDFRFGVSTVRLIVRKVSEYYGVQFIKLSVVIEDICRDEWDKLLEYQQEREERDECIVEDVPYTFRENKRIIEQTPESPWQNNRSDVINEVRHVALESLPLYFKYLNAQTEAAQRGVSWDDFQWEFPNHHETRVVRPPSAHTDTSLRAIRLDITIFTPTYGYSPDVDLYIGSIELQMISITRSPSLPNILHNTTFHLDARYAALANATIPNHSAQIIELSPDSQSPRHIVTSSGPIHIHGPLQITGPMMGDMYTGPISAGNVGGRNNTNHFIAPMTAEEVASAVLRALDSRLCDGGRFVHQTEAGRKRRRDDGKTSKGQPNWEIPQTEGRRKRTTARAMYDDEDSPDGEPLRKRRPEDNRLDVVLSQHTLPTKVLKPFF